MSRFNERTNCPRCGGANSLIRSADGDNISGLCLRCGHEYHTVSRIMSLKETNEARFNHDEAQITELSEPVKGWFG